MSQIILPQQSAMRAVITEAVATKRAVFFAGLPGVGKSLFLQQAALLAMQAGRHIHLLQWDVARSAFETEALLTKYPEVDGSTDPFIRKVVGDWSRGAIMAWLAQQPDDALLLGELPLLGNRLIELVQKRDDSAENFLASDACIYLTPVPSRQVRAAIEAARARTIAQPRNVNETKDAPPNVVQQHWRELHDVAITHGLTDKAPSDTSYDPNLYAAVYAYVMQHRNQQRLDADMLLQPAGSVYELAGITGRLQATAAEVAAAVSQLERRHAYAEITAIVDNWHHL